MHERTDRQSKPLIELPCVTKNKNKEIHYLSALLERRQKDASSRKKKPSSVGNTYGAQQEEDDSETDTVTPPTTPAKKKAPRRRASKVVRIGVLHRRLLFIISVKNHNYTYYQI